MPETKTRILVVDDSATYRRIVSSVLESDPKIDVVGSASNGKIALQKVERFRPDVVTLDIEMPEMDGLETLAALKMKFPSIRVIMVSSHTEQGAAVTLEALSRGAYDFIPKPSGGESYDTSMRILRDVLLPMVRPQIPRSPVPVQIARLVPPRPRPPVSSLIVRREVVLIGVSTGGPNALAKVIPKLPKDLKAGVAIVQHMPPMFTAQLAARLDGLSALAVREARGGELIRPGQVLIAPGGRHMVIETGSEGPRVRLTDDPPENNCRPAVDPLFRSAAQVYGGKALAVVLTGMGQDGFAGAKHLKEKGSYIFAQDEASSVVYGMPRFIVEGGLADEVLPLQRIPEEIVRHVNGPFVR